MPNSDSDYRDGNFPGPYKFSATYGLWMQLRAQVAERLKTDAEKIWFFFLAGHIGDHVSGLTVVGAFKQLRGDPPIAVISSGPPDLHDLFAHCANLFVSPCPDLMALLPMTRFAPGYPYIVEPHLYADGRLLDLFPICTLNDLVRYHLRVPMGTPLVPPRIPASARTAAEQAFARYGLAPGRTVLFAPYSNSMPRMSIEWWEAAADYLKQRGFIPVTNTPNHFGAVKTEAPVPGTIGVDLPLLQIIPFVERAGHFLAPAQGLCDLVAFANAKLKIIFTPVHFVDGLRPEDGASPTGGYSLVRNFSPACCQEYSLATDTPFDPKILDGWL